MPAPSAPDDSRYFRITRDEDGLFSVEYGDLEAWVYLQRTTVTRKDDEYYTLEKPFKSEAIVVVLDNGHDLPMHKELDTDKLLCWTFRTLVARGKLSPSNFVQYPAVTHDAVLDYERRGFTFVSRMRDFDEEQQNPGGLMLAEVSDILDYCRRWWVRVLPRRNATSTQQGSGTNSYSDLVGAAIRQGRSTFVYRGNLYKRTRNFFRKVGPAFG